MSLLSTIDTIINEFDISSNNKQIEEKKEEAVIDRETLSITCTQTVCFSFLSL